MGKKVLAESMAAAGDTERQAKAGKGAAKEAELTAGAGALRFAAAEPAKPERAEAAKPKRAKRSVAAAETAAPSAAEAPAKPKRGKKAAEPMTEAEPESEKAGRRAKAETELYAPVKRWLEARGYEVRGEVRGCDVVAVREGEPWPVVVELKKRFNLSLFLQAVERRATTPYVYVAAERSDRKNAFALSELRRLCELIGVGLLTVRLYKRKPALVELHCEPAAGNSNGAASPRAPGRRTAKLLDEFRERSGDYNAGGATGRKLVTAYREKALRCAEALHVHGPLAPRQIRDLIASDMAQSILRRNVYGWFRRERRGVYAVTPAGVAALEQFADVLRGAAAREGR